jgi:hypothetical protein
LNVLDSPSNSNFILDFAGGLNVVTRGLKNGRGMGEKKPQTIELAV